MDVWPWMDASGVQESLRPVCGAVYRLRGPVVSRIVGRGIRHGRSDFLDLRRPFPQTLRGGRNVDNGLFDDLDGLLRFLCHLSGLLRCGMSGSVGRLGRFVQKVWRTRKFGRAAGTAHVANVGLYPGGRGRGATPGTAAKPPHCNTYTVTSVMISKT